jgi:hypothetical protein
MGQAKRLATLSLAVLCLGVASVGRVLAAPSPAPPSETFCGKAEGGHAIPADPTTYRALLASLRPGDTLNLAAGRYDRLELAHLHGAEGHCIVVTGPVSGDPAIIEGTPGVGTIEIVDSHHLVVRDLRVDSRGFPGAHGISAKGGTSNPTHHIILEDNVVVGAGATQQTDGISTKATAWNWIIRRNRVLGVGTGLYLGNSEGDDPFIAGIIADNLVVDPIGYCMEVKYQTARSEIAGMPTTPSTTIIRDNVFIKSDRPSPDGDRPNLLVGGFPDRGPGSQDLYQIYGNLIVHNPREALFQASGRVSFHDNILADGSLAAAVFRDHDLKLKLARIYNNTIDSAGVGILVLNRAAEGSVVAGNLVFAARPIFGLITQQEGNLTETRPEAAVYLQSPTMTAGHMDYFPRPGRAKGSPLDFSAFVSDVDFSIDFNRNPKRRWDHRGAYSGDGLNPGWRLQADIKPVP